jgi:hypothetical protein
MHRPRESLLMHVDYDLFLTPRLAAEEGQREGIRREEEEEGTVSNHLGLGLRKYLFLADFNRK